MDKVLSKTEMMEKVKINMLNAALEQICQAELQEKFYSLRPEPETEEEKKHEASKMVKLLAGKQFNQEFIDFLVSCK